MNEEFFDDPMLLSLSRKVSFFPKLPNVLHQKYVTVVIKNYIHRSEDFSRFSFKVGQRRVDIFLSLL